MLIHELMARHAAEDPSKTAALDVRGEMGYSELETRSAAAARALSAQGQGEALPPRERERISTAPYTLLNEEDAPAGGR